MRNAVLLYPVTINKQNYFVHSQLLILRLHGSGEASRDERWLVSPFGLELLILSWGPHDFTLNHPQ